MTKLTDLQALDFPGLPPFHVARLPLASLGLPPDPYWSDWVSYTGWSSWYQIHSRLSHNAAHRLGLQHDHTINS
jgi:hypothetical protein